MEGLRLRVKDIDFEYCQITVRDGKGQKDRHTMLPTVSSRTATATDAETSVPAQTGFGDGVWHGRTALCARAKVSKCSSRVEMAVCISIMEASVDPRSKIVRRHHLYEQSVQRAMKKAIYRFLAE